MIDLPNHSILVGGLETWLGATEEVLEPRLVEKLKSYLQIPQLRLIAPPPDSEDPDAPRTGMTGWQFPEWFIAQDVESGPKGLWNRSRHLVHRKLLSKGSFFDDHKKKHSVVPIRFVRACRKGHIGDIDWRGFVHRGATECFRQLWIDERGTSGDLAEIVVRCECEKERRLSEATLNSQKPLGTCNGASPWLGPQVRHDCAEPNRLLVRSASNSYFAQNMSVISLPEKNETIGKAVASIFSDSLKELESIEELKFVRKKLASVKAALDGFDDEEIWAEVQLQKGSALQGPTKSIKQAEFEILSGTEESTGTDILEGNFFARMLQKSVWDDLWMTAIEKIVLVHRLREVVAQVGFTRFEASNPAVDGEFDVRVEMAPLAREVSWLPAVENRGEGIFIQFRNDVVKEWLERPEVKQRGTQLLAGIDVWKKWHPQSGRAFPGLPYYLLHSISHMLLTAVSLECGYPASSIRERVYSLESGYGILLYTGSPDAEGTLGGLIESGRQIHRHLQTALEIGRLCSNDPVCAQHEPPGQHEARFLHGAACHGCLLVAETSCEQQNDFLDRALVVPTVDDLGAEFFKT